jgi:hypothetical protein
MNLTEAARRPKPNPVGSAPPLAAMGFQQRCLHTSCCVVQLRLQVLVVAVDPGTRAEDPGTTIRVEAVVGTQAPRQVIATVSQLI